MMNKTFGYSVTIAVTTTEKRFWWSRPKRRTEFKKVFVNDINILDELEHTQVLDIRRV